MSGNVSRVVWETDWQPPPISALNFDSSNETLCKVAGAWKAQSLSVLQEGQELITTQFVLPYLESILPANQGPSDPWTLLYWYDNYIMMDRTSDGMPLEGSLLAKLNVFPMESCVDDICKNLDWVGDPDVSGRGMIITYYFAAGLVTVYFCALTLSSLGIIRQRHAPKSRSSLLLSAFEASVNGFLDATLIFAASMLAAACFRLSQAFLQDNGEGRGHWMLYASIGSIYMSTFSIFPPLVLQSILQDLRRNWLRILVWAIIVIFMIANEVLFEIFLQTYVKRYVESYAEDNLSDGLEVFWYWMCNPFTLLEKGILPILHLAQAILVLNAICYVAYIGWKRKSRDIQGWPRLRAFWEKVHRYIRTMNAAFCCLLMWTMIGLFHAYRDIVNGAAGEENQNSNWTFGQVLAVATWIPVAVEFLTVLKYGPEQGLSKKLSPKFTVVSATESSLGGEKEAQYARVADEHSDF
ncbi:hypothetical protein GGR53DRAFT_497817 [Hypoxylon sp. FL1150]|nr:hypothetical protein GGR53DRAFT_497817 [Hypoxylon sp. FL1150]